MSIKINKIKEHVTKGSVDVLSLYNKLVINYGIEKVFLLESLSGPIADRQKTMVGLTGLAEIAVFDNVVKFSGIDSVVNDCKNYLFINNLIDENDNLTNIESLWKIDDILRKSLYKDGNHLPILTFFGYDSVQFIEKIDKKISENDPLPIAVFSLVQAFFEIDQSNSVYVSWLDSELLSETKIDDLIKDITNYEILEEIPVPTKIHDEMSEEEFLIKAKICKDHIRVGDIYQVQLGHKIEIESTISPIEVYKRLRLRNPSPYMAILNIWGYAIVCASPELYVRVENDIAIMRPIAGTIPRSDNEIDNTQAIEKLVSDPKEIAEHIMLVDLCRNDLGRICEFGSIEVDELLFVEKYSHMYHLVSNVKCKIRKDISSMDVIKAGFPAGTMTGAPKIRAMEIIEGLENSRRGFYAGAFGILRESSAVLGLSIRMVVNHNNKYILRASAGIVHDSIPEKEWVETLTKMGATFWAVTDMEIKKWMPK